MRFIDDFNTAFSTIVLQLENKNFDEQSFIKSSYLWVPIGWFLSIIIILLGYVIKLYTDDFVIFFVVTIIAFFLKGISDITSKDNKRLTSFMLISIPFISSMLSEYHSWLVVSALYFPVLMMSKSLQLGIQGKKYNMKDSTNFINLLISVVTFFIPMYLLFNNRLDYNGSVLLSSIMFFIVFSVLISIVKDFVFRKKNSLLNFSTSGLLFIIVIIEVLEYVLKIIFKFR